MAQRGNADKVGCFFAIARATSPSSEISLRTQAVWLRRMNAVVGMPAAQADRATGLQRCPEADRRALEGRFEAAVLRRTAVVGLLSPDHPYAAGLRLPLPAGRDGHGHWWLPADVHAWVRAGLSRRRPRVTWWTRADLAEQLRLHAAAIVRLGALPGFPAPHQQGR